MNAKKEKPNKKVQLLLSFHRIIPFLHIFSEEDLSELQSIMHIFVFNRSSILAKQNEQIDYLGIIIEGRAVRKGNFLDIGELVGWEALVGAADKHTENIAAETDGLVLAIRLEDMLALEKSKYNKIIAKCAQNIYLRDKDTVQKLKINWEELDERKASKYVSADWVSIFNEMEARQKNRFFAHFPIFSAKQKSLILSHTCKPALVVLFSGQLTVKAHPNTNTPIIVNSPATYNVGAFLSGTGTMHNVYCLSSECIFWILEKDRLEKVGGKEIVRKIYEKIGEFKLDLGIKEEKKGQLKEWSLFKKYPDAQILPLKKENKQLKPKASKQIVPTLSTYQTLFKQQLGAASSNAKQLTKSSVANSNYDKLYSLKTQAAEDSVNLIQLEKLRKQYQNAMDRLRGAENANRQLKLQLIETKCRVAMGDVHRQLLRLSLSHPGGVIKINHQASVQEKQDTSGNLVTLKQAFQNQFKSNRVHVLVAKFAFRWLNTVRKRKAERKE